MADDDEGPADLAGPDDDDEDEEPRELEETGPFQPTEHHGIPIEVPGTRREGQYGRDFRRAHPPLACPAPRYPATMRGYYRCPACGEKASLAGQITGAQMGAELADRWLPAVGEALGQCWRILWESVTWAARWGAYLALVVYDRARARLESKRTVTDDNGGEARALSEVAATLALVAMLMEKNRGSGAKIPAPAPELTISTAKEDAN